MAPALVEHSTAKERNSISKEYSKLRSCLSPFDIVLLEKFGHSDPANSFDNSVKNSNFFVMNNSDKKQTQNLSFAEKTNNVKTLKDISVINLPNLKNLSTCDEKSGYKNGTLDYKLDKVSLTSEPSPVHIKNNTTGYDCKTTEIRPLQPVASLDTPSIVNYLQQKKDSCGLKFYDLNRSMNKLNSRLRLLQSKHISAHVASHVKKHDTHEDSKSKYTDTKNKKDISFDNSELSLQKPWKELRKIHDMVNVNADDTDCEDDLEIKQRIPAGRNKKKSDNPPPPLEALHQWKIKRAHIGSQCSWLSLKISTLDKKIAELDELYKKQKSEGKPLKKYASIENICSTTLDTPHGETELNVTPPVGEEQICRRVLPYTNIRRHNYIEQTLNTEKRKRSSCRCLSSSSGSCRLCLHSKGSQCTDLRNTRAAKLDHSYHSTLSYENDVSLSFLLEETLRKQRINTKVTISKPTKKKKKKKIKEGSGNTESLEKDHGGIKHSSTSKLSLDKNHVKSKGERSKLDDYPTRKRSSVLETTARSKKSRKLSESEESWKPTTPTSELNSPLQSHATSAFFPLKQRKKVGSSGGDYDINNIVIPYSMAATTRLERIQYKEIPTPGWRNVDDVEGHSKVPESEEVELTDDEIFLDRHTRCEVTERKKFADYYKPVLRRRPYHLSESTASGPPSPLISDELTRSNINTPVDSPVTNTSGSTPSGRIINVIAVPEEEREPIWATRTYPLDDVEFKNLRISSTTTSSSVVTTSDILSKSSFVFKYPDASQIIESCLQTPLSTPAETPMPSPSGSPNGTPSDLDGSEGSSSNPHNWTVKAMIDPSSDVVTTATQPRTGIVLKLAKK